MKNSPQIHKTITLENIKLAFQSQNESLKIQSKIYGIFGN